MNDGADRAEKLQQLTNFFLVGDLAGAEDVARQLIAADGKDSEAQHLLAQIVFKEGRAQEAVDLMRLALELDPTRAGWNNDYGVMLTTIGRWDEAAAAYGMAAVLDSSNVDARFNLALALFRSGQKERARIELDRALALNPDLSDALALKAEMDAELQREQNLGEYEEACEKDSDASFRLANFHYQQGDKTQAERFLRRAIAQRPDFAQAYDFLGKLLMDKGEMTQAVACLACALASHPAFAPAYTHLGGLNVLGDLPESALFLLERAVQIDPQSSDAWNNFGSALSHLNRVDEAEKAYRRALEIQPDSAMAEFNLGTLLLRCGQFAEGWACYEKRKSIISDNYPQKIFQPQWGGETLGARSLLVHHEQGLGDNLQFVRYLPLLRERYPEARIAFRCPSPLFRLFAPHAADWGVEILPEKIDMASFDLHVAIMTLPWRMETTVETIPATIPYLVPLPTFIQQGAARLASVFSEHPHAKKVGIVWRTSTRFNEHVFRTLSLEAFAPLFEIAGIQWVSLQIPAGEIAEKGMSGRVFDPMGEVEDFADTAGLAAHLDLVISADTSVAHLAGAMGKPVWLLSRFDADWRWLLDREDSPWYPTMRIFRQPSCGDWEAVIQNVARALSDWIAEGSDTPARARTSPFPIGTRAAKTASAPVLSSAPVKPAAPLKLNLGCGNRKQEGFINVDRVAICQPDCVVDLEKTPWPWPDNSVGEIWLTHVLEHLGQTTSVFLAIIQEMYRVCRDGARIEITVPHPRSDEFLGDPTHVRPVTNQMLSLFSQKLNREWAIKKFANTPLALILGVDFEIESCVHTPTPEWQARFLSGNLSQADLNQAARQYNNVIAQSTIIWCARKS